MIGYRTTAVPQQSSWTQSQAERERKLDLLNRDWTRPTGAVPGVEEHACSRPVQAARAAPMEQPPLLTVEGYGYKGAPLVMPPLEDFHNVPGIEERQGLHAQAAAPGAHKAAQEEGFMRKAEGNAAKAAEGSAAQDREARRKTVRKRQQQSSRALRLLTMLPLAACAVQRLFVEAFQDAKQSMKQGAEQTAQQQAAAAPGQAASKPSFSTCAPGY